MARFRELYRVVDAVQYDGTPDSVAALAALVPDWISRSLDGADLLVTTTNVFGEARLHVIAPGEWVTAAGLSSRAPKVVDDAYFTMCHEKITP